MKRERKKKKQKKLVIKPGEDTTVNRRNFLAKLDPKVRDFAVKEFAKLGLYQ